MDQSDESLKLEEKYTVKPKATICNLLMPTVYHRILIENSH